MVTGATGYLGHNLVHLLKEAECRILRVGRPGSTFPAVSGCAQIIDVTGDIRDPGIWNDLVEPAGVVFHFAAQTSVYVAGEKPSEDLNINVLPTLHLLETCMRKGVSPTVLFAGTATQCGIADRLPVDETQPDNPITIYDIHKLASERYLNYFSDQGTVKASTLRLGNVYGPGPESGSADRGVLNRMVRRALQGEPLTVYGKGDRVRDYVYVEDVVRAFVAAAEGIDRVKGKHFVIGSGRGCTIAQALHLVAERVSLKTGKGRVAVEHVQPPPRQSAIEDRNFIADSRRFTQHTGWTPRISLEEGIDRTIDHVLGKGGAGE